jgi:signal transduction histidine kinase
MKTERGLSLSLFSAFTVVALSFVAARIYTSWLSVEIERETQQMAESALPSIERLMAANDALRDLEAATDDYADLGVAARPAARRQIDVLRQTLDTQLSAYVELPFFSRERERYREVPAALAELDDAIRVLYAKFDAGDREAERQATGHDVQVKANQVAGLLRRLASFNATQAYSSVLAIRDTRHQTVLLAGLLDALTLLMTVGIALGLWRAIRSYSHLQQAHADLVERRNDELEIFGRRVAHDLLSPLSSLTYCLTAFKPFAQREPKLENALGRANQCVRRAQGLVDDIFDFARSGGAPRPGARAEVDEVVQQVMDEARAECEAAGERVAIEVGELPGCAALCSRGVLASILGNLVRNAVKYTTDSAVRRVAIRGVEIGGAVRLEVEDTGPGIPPGLGDSIFEPYVRAEGLAQPGLGLGLATVKRFCEAHGGSVGVRSTPDLGSVFYVTLPCAPEGSPRYSGWTQTPTPPSASGFAAH